MKRRLRNVPAALAAAGLVLIQGAPFTASAAETCPASGCARPAPAAKPAPPVRPAPARPPGTVAPPLDARAATPARDAGPAVARPSGPRPGPFGSTVLPRDADRGAAGARPGVYSQKRTFSFHGRAFAAIRARPYRYSRGFAYRPFIRGQRFPAFLLLTPYFIYNYYLYNLSVPPEPGVVWVRFGPDALLVNTYTGEVIDTAPGLFDEDPGDGSAYAQGPPGADYGPPPPGYGSPPPPPGYGSQPPGPGPQDGDATAYPGPSGYPEPPPPGGP
jgi:Ni/Co efflux regulator RcnB